MCFTSFCFIFGDIIQNFVLYILNAYCVIFIRAKVNSLPTGTFISEFNPDDEAELEEEDDLLPFTGRGPTREEESFSTLPDGSLLGSIPVSGSATISASTLSLPASGANSFTFPSQGLVTGPSRHTQQPEMGAPSATVVSNSFSGSNFFVGGEEIIVEVDPNNSSTHTSSNRTISAPDESMVTNTSTNSSPIDHPYTIHPRHQKNRRRPAPKTKSKVDIAALAMAKMYRQMARHNKARLLADLFIKEEEALRVRQQRLDYVAEQKKKGQHVVEVDAGCRDIKDFFSNLADKYTGSESESERKLQMFLVFC